MPQKVSTPTNSIPVSRRPSASRAPWKATLNFEARSESERTSERIAPIFKSSRVTTLAPYFETSIVSVRSSNDWACALTPDNTTFKRIASRALLRRADASDIELGLPMGPRQKVAYQLGTCCLSILLRPPSIFNAVIPV